MHMRSITLTCASKTSIDAMELSIAKNGKMRSAALRGLQKGVDMVFMKTEIGCLVTIVECTTISQMAETARKRMICCALQELGSGLGGRSAWGRNFSAIITSSA